MTVKDETIMWKPSEEFKNRTILVNYMKWLEKEKNLKFNTYDELWEWSVTKIEDFWETVWEFFKIDSKTPYDSVLNNRSMLGAEWFAGASLNYAEHIFRNAKKGEVAMYFQSETQPLKEIKWDELIEKTSNLITYLKSIGVKKGDRIVGYMPNIPETVISFLATASIGAIWSSCAPEFGEGSVLSRFQQIEPKVLLAVDGYQYNGKQFDRLEIVSNIEKQLPSIEKTVIIPNLSKPIDTSNFRNVETWENTQKNKGDIQFESVPFEHPLWIVYSSGTTGLPKSMVHGHGGILLNQFVTHSLQSNVSEDDRFMYFTTTGWIVWNNLVSSLLTGAKIILYDGSPSYPDISVLWKIIEQTKSTSFGTSPVYINQCMDQNIKPGETYNLESLSQISVTGSPLSPSAYDWIYSNVKEDLWLAPVSGGTDICGTIVGTSPLIPVYKGEMSCRTLGVAVYSFNEEGKSVTNEMGEMVITEPMPSMPVFFWNDPNNQKYEESYFDVYPDKWRHGDLLEITDRGTAIIHGRSDATINRMGIRAGSSEIYNAIESIKEIKDSLVIDLSGFNRKSYMPLFVVLHENTTLTEELQGKINNIIKKEVSPRHIPDEIFVVPDIPRTLSNKKMEIPVRKILQGIPAEKVVNVDSIQNPNSIQFYVDFYNDNLV